MNKLITDNLATWFGIGLVKKAPGTAASLCALPLAFPIHYFCGPLILLGFGIIILIIGWWATFFYTLQKTDTDPKEVVIDEIAGQFILLSAFLPTLESYVTGFLLFRLFDIFKPWPISYIDRKMKTPLGTMLDDLLAAFYPLLIMLVIFYLSINFDGYDTMLPITRWLEGNHGFY